MLTRAQINERVRFLGGFGAGDIPAINTMIEITERDLYYGNYRWPWLESSDILLTIPGQGNYPMPGAVQEHLSLAPVEQFRGAELRYVQDADFRPWEHDPLRPPTTLARPTRYTIYQGEIWLSPIPDQEYEYRHLYIYAPPLMSADVDEPVVPPGFENVLIYGALALMSARDKNVNMMPMWSQQYQQALQALRQNMVNNQRHSSTKVPMPDSYGRQH